MSTTAVGAYTNSHAAMDTLAAALINLLANELEYTRYGYAAVDAAGTGDLTLNTTTEEPYSVLYVTGVLTGNRNLIVSDDAGRRWIVINATTGSFTLTLKTAAGTGITITQGYTALVAGDVTNILRLTPDISGSLIVLSQITDTNGNELVKFTATGSAVNEWTIVNAATGSGPSIASTGGDTNIDATFKGKGTGKVILGQATSTGVQLAADQALLDSNGNELVKFVATGSAVNEVTVTNTATGTGPSLAATGGDTNIDCTLKGKGTGKVILGQATSTGVQLAADQAVLDSSGNELVKWTKAASAVNELTIANSAAGNAVTLSATGGDTDINLALTPKGAGFVNVTAGGFQVRATAAVTATVGGGTTGLIPAGASFVVVTSDDANKQISLPAASVGDRIRILVGATGCELISVTAADKVNDVTIGATNEAALTAENLYDCQYVATNTWVVIGYTKLGAVQAALVPDAL